MTIFMVKRKAGWLCTTHTRVNIFIWRQNWTFCKHGRSLLANKSCRTHFVLPKRDLYVLFTPIHTISRLLFLPPLLSLSAIRQIFTDSYIVIFAKSDTYTSRRQNKDFPQPCGKLFKLVVFLMKLKQIFFVKTN